MRWLINSVAYGLFVHPVDEKMRLITNNQYFRILDKLVWNPKYGSYSWLRNKFVQNPEKKCRISDTYKVTFPELFVPKMIEMPILGTYNIGLRYWKCTFPSFKSPRFKILYKNSDIPQKITLSTANYNIKTSTFIFSSSLQKNSIYHTTTGQFYRPLSLF